MICYEYLLFYFWVLVSVEDPLSRVFVMILVVPTQQQLLQRGCCFNYQISARLSAPAKGLLSLIEWKALSMVVLLVVLLLSTVLGLYPLYMGQSLALSKGKEEGVTSFCIFFYQFWVYY